MNWVHALLEYGLGVVWEADHRSKGLVPTFDDYTLMRRHSGAVPAVQALLELGTDGGLDADQRDSPPVRVVSDIANFIISWDNDIFSFHKESRGRRYWLNAVRVLSHERGLTLENAVRECVNQRDQATGLYLRIRDHLARSGNARLSGYLRALDSFIRGAQDWEITSVRYLCPDDPAPHPDRLSNELMSSGEPLDISAHSWWWDTARLCGAIGTVAGKD
jgi:hypothetical protein